MYYLTIKCPRFNYTHLLSDDVVKSRISQNDAVIIKDCMKQHLKIFAPNEPVLCKEYLCSCNACLWFDFKECLGDNITVYAEFPCNDYLDDDEEVDAIDKTEQIFDFRCSIVCLAFKWKSKWTPLFCQGYRKSHSSKRSYSPIWSLHW